MADFEARHARQRSRRSAGDRHQPAAGRRGPCHAPHICVGQLTALAFVAVIDDPSRIRRSRDIRAYLGLVPRRYQSGEVDYTGRHLEIRGPPPKNAIERGRQRHADYKGQLKLKDSAFAIAKRSTMRKARIFVARHMCTRCCGRKPSSRQPWGCRPTRQEIASSSRKERRPRERADHGARFRSMRRTTGQLRSQPSRPASNSPHRAPNGCAESAGIPRRRHPEELPVLTH